MPAVPSSAGAASEELIFIKNFLMDQLTNSAKSIHFFVGGHLREDFVLSWVQCAEKRLVLLTLLAGKRAARFYVICASFDVMP